jgi:phosphoesterase RecJ-like protein
MIDLLKECGAAARIGISGHVRPDGDCVGSCLALAGYIKKSLPETEVKVYLEKPADIFNIISGYEDIVSDYPDEDKFDLFIVLDSDFERTGDAKKYIAAAARTINIDHHVSNEGCGDVNVCRPDVGSVCEVLFDLLEKDRIDCDIAKALYIGIIHDTGVFQYSNTRPETLNTAAYLIGFGFDFSKIIEETFYQKTYLQTQIMGRALMESVRFMDGRCIVGWVNRKIMDFYNVTSKDFEGIVNQLRNIKGIDCAIFMYEISLNEYKVSMRSTENVDVAKVAAYFGGGGHVRAAGCTMNGTLHDCVNNLSQHILEQLKDD